MTLAFDAGAVIGVLGGMIGVFGFFVPPEVILPLLVTLLLASSVKVWRYQ